MHAIPKRSILITGCSSGIGRDAAITLQARGYKVYATVRQKKDLADLQKSGLNTHILDVTCKDSISLALEWVMNDNQGKIDALFNNGAYGQPGAVEDLSTDALRAQFETNFFGWHELTRQVIAIMREQGGGRIIQNSSVLGFVSMPYRGAYNASKHALEALSDTLRMELRGTNISISLIEPGPIATHFRQNALDKFKECINIENSHHKRAYEAQLERLGQDIANTFTLPPSAVTKKLIHALESKRPKQRYYVTFPTYLFGFLKRVLPTKMLDNLLIKG